MIHTAIKTQSGVLTALLSLVLLIFLYGCADDKDNLITGEWKVKEMYTGNTQEELDLENIPEEIRKEAKRQVQSALEDMKNDTRFLFNADGSYEENIGGLQETGTWKAAGGGEAVVLTKTGGESSKKYRIESLTDSTMVIHTDINGQSVQFSLIPA